MREPAPHARSAHRSWRLAAQFATAALVLAWGAACDNPACVFGPNGCTGVTSGASSSAAATVPANHQWVEVGVPTITGKIPFSTGTPLGTDAPMALIFSESIAQASLANALRVEESGGGGLGAVIQSTNVLVCEGRVLVVLPLEPLTLGASYDLVWNQNAAPVDLQGQALVIPESRVAATFTVATTAPSSLRLMGTFPADNSSNESGVGEFIVLFDRKVNPLTVTANSFDVTVAGVPPAFDALAVPLSISAGGVSTSDTRVYRWHSVDASLEAAPLGAGLQFGCSLSPVGNKITAVDTTVLPAILVEYDIALISPALSAEIVSLPTDAIGIDNISGPMTLDVAVTLEAAQIGDRLGVFVFGNSVGANPKRIALFREVALTTTATTVHIGEAELDLATDQAVGRLADGTLNFAIRMQRGAVTTPVRMLDADMSVSGVQSPILDTQPPTLTGLGTSGTNVSTFRSDLRDFSLVGRANERIRAVEVSTSIANNGILTPVVGGTTTGLFVAAPVLLGNLTPAQMPLPFTAVIYDNALNAALVPIAGDFTQLGASGPGGSLPGPSITVEVFDSASFAVVPNARVMIHEDIGGGTVLPIDSGLTGPSGTVTLSAGFVGETFVTVDMTGYDLFTFEDVPTDRLSVPLTRSGTLPATVAGVVSSKSAAFPSFDRSVVDSRRPHEVEPQIVVQTCSTNPTTQASDCGYGPGLIRGNMLGVTSLFALEIPASEVAYNALSFLRAFQIAIPVAPVPGGSPSIVSLTTNNLLSDSSVDPEERAIDGPAITLDLSSTNGIVLASLAGDPRILVEAQVRGLPGAGAVGLGIAFPSGGNTWSVRAAYPGAVDGIQDTPQDALGKLVAAGVIDPDLRLSCEVRDTFGARAGRRPRFSQLGASLKPVSAPVILSPLPGAGTGGPSFDLTITNAIPNAAGTPGMYVATIAVVPSGRRWTIWRPDLPDGTGPTRTIHVPDLAALGGVALPDGPLSAVVAAFGFQGFTTSDFLWSDIEREYDSFSAGVPTAFTQP